MNFKQLAHSWPINYCHDFWKFPKNEHYFWSPDNPSLIPNPRDFHMGNIFASEHADICAPYRFPSDGMVKNHAFAGIKESTHYPNFALEGLHHQVMGFHNPPTKMTDKLPEALDIDLFLEEIFEAAKLKSTPATPNSSTVRQHSNGKSGESRPQPPAPQVPLHLASAVPPKPEGVTKKRVTKAYSPCQKIQYVDLFRKACHEAEGRSFSQRQFARKHQLSHARFSAWCKEYDKLKSLDASQLMVSRVRMPSARFPVLESRMTEWIAEQRTVGRAEPAIRAIQTHARELAVRLGISDFVASSTWVERFRRRCDTKPSAKRPDKEGSQGTLSLT